MLQSAASSMRCVLKCNMGGACSLQYGLSTRSLRPPMMVHVQATAELNQERSARLTAEQQVLKLRGQLDAIAQVRAQIPLSLLGRNREKCGAWMRHQSAVLWCFAASPRAAASAEQGTSGALVARLTPHWVLPVLVLVPQAEEAAREQAAQSLRALQGEFEEAKVSFAGLDFTLLGWAGLGLAGLGWVYLAWLGLA